MSRIREGILEIQRTYWDRGFLKATVKEPLVEVVESSGAAWPIPIAGKATRYWARVKLSIFEGPRFRYGRVQLPLLHQDLPLQLPEPGAYYSEAEVVDCRKSLVKHFRMKGGFLADFQIRQQLSQLTRSMDLTVSFRILPPLSVRRIEFVGHSVFPDSFYRRELHLRESAPLDARKLEQSLEALRRTGALISIERENAEITVHSDEKEADLLIHLHEKDRQRVQFSAGPDGLYNLDLSLLYTISNLIGLEEKMGLQLQIGSNMSELDLGTTFRHLLGSSLPLDLAMGFFRRNTGLRLPGVDEYLRRLFFRKSYGLSGSTRFHFLQNHSVSLDSGLEKVVDPNPALHWLLRPSWQLDQKTPQISRRLQTGQRFSVFKGTPESWNWGSDASWRAQLPVSVQPGDNPLSLRFEAAWTRLFGERAPLSERLLNGDELRGFPPSSGPWGEVDGALIPIGGDTRLSLSSEYEQRLHNVVSLVPFADAGILFSRSDARVARLAASTNRVWRSSLGSKVRLNLTERLPMPRLILAWNPLRLDRHVRTSKGLARLRDPAFAFRVRF